MLGWSRHPNMQDNILIAPLGEIKICTDYLVVSAYYDAAGESILTSRNLITFNPNVMRFLFLYS